MAQTDTLSPRERIIRRATQEIQDGMIVNLGIGMPTLLADAGLDKAGVLLQSENGLLGIGPYPADADVDPDLINAGKETITAAAGHSYFDSADSFAMIRGGHVDLAILGGMEVSATGDLANWMVPGKMIKGMGGAMDLVQGAKRTVVIMEHLAKSGDSKLKPACTLPLTGVSVVDRLITDLAVFDFIREGDDPARHAVLVEIQPGTTLAQVKSATEAPFDVSEALLATTEG
ncbi:MAG TPA: 3-oxoacid CoA-transferase subunit B [Conexibacter sp.]|jgi:3-oxoacid CoA-transferase subunit B